MQNTETMLESVIMPVFIFGIPLMLVTILPFGWLKSRSIYLLISLVLAMAEIAFFVYGILIYAQYRAFGSTGPSPWDSWTPLLLVGTFCIVCITIGFLIRPRRISATVVPVTRTFKTIREVNESLTAEMPNKTSHDNPY